MRISEIIQWNIDTTLGNHSDSRLDVPPGSFNRDPANLANAFTRRGLVKSFWNLNGTEAQPSEPAPPDAGAALIPSGTIEPTVTYRQAGSAATQPKMGVPSARSVSAIPRGVRRLTSPTL